MNKHIEIISTVDENGERHFQEVEYDPIQRKKETERKQQKRRDKYSLPLSKDVRSEILRRCEILRYMGDDGISSIYYESTDEELLENYSWVLDKEHDEYLADEFVIKI